jgi:putative intracellular protease/amidase
VREIDLEDGRVALPGSVRNYAAVVLTAVDRLPDDRMCGYWLPEAAYPWLALAGAGWTVVSISTLDSPPSPGGVDRTDPVQRRFLDDPAIRRALAGTRRVEFYQPEDFAVLVLAGGAGAVFDLPEDAALGAFAAGVLRTGGLLACCGYGAAGLLPVAAVDAELLRDRLLTTTSPAEEQAQELTGLLPRRLPDELAGHGAVTRFADPFRSHVLADRTLLSGQNPASAPQLARRLLNAIAAPSSTGGNAGQ